MKINQLIKKRNKKLYENGALFILLIIAAIILDRAQSSLFNTIFSTMIKLSSLYGLILLSRRIRQPLKCPCCGADLSFDAYSKNKEKVKTCPFCHIRFDQDSVAYKRKLAEMKENNEVVADEEFFE